MGQHPNSHRKNKSEIVCRCNNISRETIENAIREGADTMNKIYDCTTAGVGPCGGSCRRKIVPLLEVYLETGDFPKATLRDPKIDEYLNKNKK